MSWAVTIVGGVVAAGSAAYGAISADKKKQRAEKEAKRALANAPDYTPSVSSRNMLADAIASQHSINPATQLAYQQNQQAAANQTANAQRNATSGAEALAVGSAAQNNFQSTIPGLVANQTQFQQGNRLQYNQALENMTQEERYAFENKKNKNNDLINYYLGLAGAANANKSAAISGGLAAASSLGNKVGSYGK